MIAARLALGATALVFALDGVNLFTSATLITLSVVLEGVTAQIARWRRWPAGPYEAVLGALADYLTWIVAPWVLLQSMLVGQRSPFQELLLDLPLLAGAVRGARRAAAALDEGRSGTARGLDAVCFAFISVTAVFVRLPALLSISQLTMIAAPVVAVVAVLMVAPLRYPSLEQRPGLAVVSLIFVAVMPFLATEVLASGLMIAGALYFVVAPFLVSQSSAPSRAPH